jgi:hypothetical protein
MLMPVWMAPGVRLITHQPAASAHLDFPRPSREPEAESWSWRAECGETLGVRAWIDSPTIGEGPRLGSWDETVRYFAERPRGYALGGGALRRIDVEHGASAIWPLRAELDGGELLPRLLPLAGDGDAGNGWPPLHSVWLAPEMPFVVSVALSPSAPVVSPVPHPAASRVASPVLRSEARQRVASEPSNVQHAGLK